MKRATLLGGPQRLLLVWLLVSLLLFAACLATGGKSHPETVAGRVRQPMGSQARQHINQFAQNEIGKDLHF